MAVEFKKNNPLISVIMPVYNKRAYIGRAIASVQAQSYTNWEMIIVDDGSNDGSMEVIPDGDSRIRVFRQPNAGPSAARNKGFDEANGTLLAFIDADDYYYPNKMACEIELLIHQKAADWMVSARHYQAAGGTHIRPICDIAGKPMSGDNKIIENAILQLTLSDWHINGLCLNRRLAEEVQGFDRKMRCYEITDLIYRCALIQPKIMVHPQPLHCQVDVPGSTFKNPRNRIEGQRLLGEKLFALSQAHSRYASRLNHAGRDIMLDYSGRLILTGARKKSRHYLMYDFRFRRNLRWWKMWLASWLPDYLIDRWLSHKLNLDVN